jgi:HSP20 family protein
MSITRWNPLQDIMTLQNSMDRFFNDPLFQPLTFNGAKAGLPTLDIKERDGELVVQAAIPGYTPEQVDVTVQGDVLTLRGTMEEEQERKEDTYHLRERHTGSFHRSIRLPASVNTEEATAEYDNGVLTLRLPKTGESAVKRIQIRSES